MNFSCGYVSSFLRVMYDHYMSGCKDVSSSASLILELCIYFNKERSSKFEELRILQSILSDSPYQ